MQWPYDFLLTTRYFPLAHLFFISKAYKNGDAQNYFIEHKDK